MSLLELNGCGVWLGGFEVQLDDGKCGGPGS